MKTFIRPLKSSKGMMNIGIALGIGMVVATFMAPLGLYYLNMYNENEKARLRTQSSEIVEGLGKLIYNTYATAPSDPTIGCPSGTDVNLTVHQVNLAEGQRRLMIHVNGNKNMSGEVSGKGLPTLPGGGGTPNPNQLRMCTPPDKKLCQEIMGRMYCVDFSRVEIASLDSSDPATAQIVQVPVSTKDMDSSLLDKLRWKTAPLAAKTASWMNRTFGDEAYQRAYAQGLESFGTVVDSPGSHSPIVTRNNFQQARLRGKQCRGVDNDPAALTTNHRNHCVSCVENSVVCIRYSLCLVPGATEATPAEKPEDCADRRHFLQGMVAMFPDRI